MSAPAPQAPRRRTPPATRRRVRPARTQRWAVAAAIAALSCGPSAPAGPAAPAAGEPTTGGTAVVAVGSDISGFNPLIDGADTFNQEILDALFLQLFEEQPDFADHPATFAPELAEAWEWSDNGRELELRLRAGVTWSDGEPLTAADVVWSWRRQIDPEIAWRYVQSKEAIESVEALDDLRLRVRFTGPATTRLAELNEGHILPRHRWRELPTASWGERGDWFVDNLVVSGPFRLARWKPQQEIVLERNPAFYRPGLPRLDRVVFRIVPEPSNRLNQLLAGAVDFVPSLPAAAAKRVAADPDARIVSFVGRQFNCLCWNLANPLFAEVEARRALTMAIDREALVETLLYGYGAVGSSPIPGNIWAHHPAGPLPHDPERARRLLAGLGWAPGEDGVLERGGRRFAFDLLTNADNRMRVDATVMIQEDLRQIGVAARPRQLEQQTVNDRALAHDFDAVLLGISIDTSLDLGYAFHSASIDDGLNVGGYSKPEVDRLIEQSRAATEIAERGRLLAAIQEILQREQPMTFLWEPHQIHGLDRRLQGARPNPLSALFAIEEWWLAAGAGPG